MIHKYKKAVKFFQNGDLKAALLTAQKALGSINGAEKIKFLNLIGIIYHQLGLYNQAVGAFKRSLELDTENFKTWENLGIIYRRLNDFTEAERCFLQALDLNPTSDEVLTSLGVVYLFIDEVAKAICCFERSLEINSSWSITYGNLALAYALDSNFQEADQSLEKANFLGFQDYKQIKERINNLKAFASTGQLSPAHKLDDGEVVLH